MSFPYHIIFVGEMEGLFILIKNIGYPGATIVGFFYAFHKGWIVTGREVATIEKLHDEKEAAMLEACRKTEEMKNAQLQQLRDQYVVVVDEKDMWRGVAFKAHNIAEAIGAKAKTNPGV